MRRILLTALLLVLTGACTKNEKAMANMTIKQDFESNVLAGQSPNIIVLQDVDNYVDVDFVIHGVPVYTRYTALLGEVEINVQDVTKLVYQYKNDTFDYSGNEQYDVNAKYHIAKMSMDIVDASGVEIYKEVVVLNASLQIGDPTTMDWYLDRILSEGAVKMPAWRQNGTPYPISQSKLGYHSGDYVIQRRNHADASEIIDVDCGTYVKWLNQKGGYAYWLFRGKHREKISPKPRGEVTEHWTSRVLAPGTHQSLGFEERRTRVLKTKVNDEYLDEFMTLLSSPEIYLYTGDLTTHSWVKVGIKGKASIVRGNTFNTVEVEIQMPKKYTIQGS